MKKAVKDFQKRLLRNPSAIALFYYSGHGSQAYGESYLIPIDGDTRDEADVEADGVKVETIAVKMANARTKANILFLDACRDVPTGTMGGTKGLGQVKHRPSGSLIVYSTSKDTTAKDDRLFNKVVLQKLAMNIPLTTLANDISYTVDQKTEGSQVPEVFAKSLPTLCLTGSCANNEVKVVEKIVYRDPPKTATQTRRVDSSTNNMEGITSIDGLMYQNQPFTKGYTWKEAKGYCRELHLGGYDNWRLPTRAELNKVSNIKMYGKYDNNWSAWFNKNKNKRLKGSKNSHFVKGEFIANMTMKYSWFWTSESKDSSDAWVVYFYGGFDYCYIKALVLYALCVR